jgi:hypothetical protein
LGAALLEALTRRDWISKDLDSRALSVTKKGEKQFPAFFGPADEQSAASAARRDRNVAA